MTFQNFGLDSRILDGVKKQGYTEPSQIQKEAIPVALKGRDILGCAQTGTGKTAAFALPILQKLNTGFVKPADRSKRNIRSLILTPTRELAVQIYDSIKQYGKYLKLKCAVIVGGVSEYLHREVISLGTDILIATPGRLLEYTGKGKLDLSHVEIFVLDEADRMLDMGFVHDVTKTIAYLPKKRQTLFFTATMPDNVRKLANSMLTNPVSIAAERVSSTTDLTEQFVYYTDKASKTDLLLHLLKTDDSMQSVLIFTRTKYGADKLCGRLKRENIMALAIHGDKSQGARQNALTSFKTGKIRVLIATDIAARGIDIDGLSHVINYEISNVAETYVHRIGRTGRAGKTGKAISLCDYDEKEYVVAIEKLTKKPITVCEDNPYPMTVFVKSPPKVPQPRPQKREYQSHSGGQRSASGQRNSGGQRKFKK